MLTSTSFCTEKSTPRPRCWPVLFCYCGNRIQTVGVLRLRSRHRRHRPNVAFHSSSSSSSCLTFLQAAVIVAVLPSRTWRYRPDVWRHHRRRPLRRHHVTLLTSCVVVFFLSPVIAVIMTYVLTKRLFRPNVVSSSSENILKHSTILTDKPKPLRPTQRRDDNRYSLLLYHKITTLVPMRVKSLIVTVRCQFL